MKISEASTLSGLPIKTIRYYESIGLIESFRKENGYREYDNKDVEKMNFLHRSRQLGFSLNECRQLLALYQNPHRASKSVKAVAEVHLNKIDKQIEQLTELKKTLTALVSDCAGDEKPECSILEGLLKQDDSS